MSVKDAATGEARNATSPATQPQQGIHDSELREIVDVATSYLETGLFDDADDILQEVLEAGAVSPEIEELIRRIELARTESGHSSTPTVQDDDQVPAAPVRRQPLVHLTSPLPGADRLPRPVQRLIADTERDFNDGRRQSALDLCNLVTARAPDFIPNYLRAAQIRIALGDAEGATSLVSTVEQLHKMDGVEDDPMIRGIRVAMNPDDVEGLVAHARHLLSQQIISVNDPFLPAAIEATQDSDPETARELARALVERRPNDDQAIRTYIRAAVTSGEPEEIHQALREQVDPDSTAIDLLWWRAASAITHEEPDWPEWLARAGNLVRTKTDNYGQARVAINRSESFVPEHIRYLGGAVIALAADQWDTAQAELEDWNITVPAEASDLEAFIGACARVEVIEYLGLQGLIPALDDLLTATVTLETRGILTSFDLFSMKTSRKDLFERYKIAIQVHDDIEHGLEFLKDLSESNPDDLDLRRGYAQLLIEHGKINKGIRELRSIARAHEQAGDLQSMADAMRSISQAVPKNIEIKQMLIDVYLRRGILDEALRELESVAALKHDAQDISGAIQAYTRAAEIACAMGNFTLGNELYDRGVATDPDNVPVRHAAVAFYLQTGAVDRATDHLSEVVRIALAEQDPDEAVAALHQIIGLDPSNIDSYHKLGEVLTAMGEYQQAERVYRRLSDISPHDPVLQAKQSALAVLAATG